MTAQWLTEIHEQLSATAVADEIDEQYSNKVNINVENPSIEISNLTSTPRYVKEGELITYSVNIKNNGNNPVYNLKIKDSLPSEVSFKEATYTYAEVENKVDKFLNEDNIVSIYKLLPGTNLKIDIVVKAGILSDTDEKEVRNKVTVGADNIFDKETNTVVNTIEYSESLHRKLEEQKNDGVGGSGGITGEGTGNIPSISGYKITGIAWIDEDRDGERAEEEKVLSGITVRLIKKEDNSLVATAVTNEKGEYEFNGLQKGNYYIIFQYDAARYSITTYRKEGIDEALNCDVISINASIDGVRQIVGISDALEVKDGNVRNIDIGLYESEKFDLKLDKYISKITVTTPKKTKTYNYKNSKIAKPEIANSNLGKSSVAIEYKIVVTNEGAVPGYVKKVVDYLPEGIKFNTELNKDWYLSDNGNIYNASLANTIINPGETKELTLVVTKKYSKVETINNSAEIYESYNEQGLEDIDSEPANMLEDEDDYSRADVILSLNTGTVIRYTTYVLGSLTIIACSIILIRKKVLKSEDF